MPPRRLSDDEIASRLGALDGWELVEGEIQKTHTLKDFQQAMLFVGAVGYLAEAAGHHPGISISWNTVILSLATHSAGGLTEHDFDLARQIDALPRLT